MLSVRIPTSCEGRLDSLLTLASQFSSTNGEFRERGLDLGIGDRRRSGQRLEGGVRIIDFDSVPVIVVIPVLPPQRSLYGPAVLLVVVVRAVSISGSNVFRGPTSPIAEEEHCQQAAN
jgi:hypothetical protein